MSARERERENLCSESPERKIQLQSVKKHTRAHTHACTRACAGQGYFHLRLSELNTDDFTDKKQRMDPLKESLTM